MQPASNLTAPMESPASEFTPAQLAALESAVIELVPGVTTTNPTGAAGLVGDSETTPDAVRAAVNAPDESGAEIGPRRAPRDPETLAQRAERTLAENGATACDLSRISGAVKAALGHPGEASYYRPQGAHGSAILPLSLAAGVAPVARRVAVLLGVKVGVTVVGTGPKGERLLPGQACVKITAPREQSQRIPMRETFRRLAALRASAETK